MTPHIRNDPLIFTFFSVQIRRSTLAKLLQPNKELVAILYSKQKGELLIQDLWQKGMGFILNMHVMNTDAASYVQKYTWKILLTKEW